MLLSLHSLSSLTRHCNPSMLDLSVTKETNRCLLSLFPETTLVLGEGHRVEVLNNWVGSFCKRDQFVKSSSLLKRSTATRSNCNEGNDERRADWVNKDDDVLLRIKIQDPLR